MIRWGGVEVYLIGLPQFILLRPKSIFFYTSRLIRGSRHLQRKNQIQRLLGNYIASGSHGNETKPQVGKNHQLTLKGLYYSLGIKVSGEVVYTCIQSIIV